MLTEQQKITVRRLADEMTAEIRRLELRRQELLALLPEEPRPKRNQQPLNPRSLR
ncbi:MAG: hypothetical protein RBS34_12890 [Desulfofustis sp.]|jgi:hypothetical protein|nr:hypothetical protein [Desulfofustis sp.]